MLDAALFIVGVAVTSGLGLGNCKTPAGAWISPRNRNSYFSTLTKEISLIWCVIVSLRKKLFFKFSSPLLGLLWRCPLCPLCPHGITSLFCDRVRDVSWKLLCVRQIADTILRLFLRFKIHFIDLFETNVRALFVRNSIGRNVSVLKWWRYTFRTWVCDLYSDSCTRSLLINSNVAVITKLFRSGCIGRISNRMNHKRKFYSSYSVSTMYSYSGKYHNLSQKNRR